MRAEVMALLADVKENPQDLTPWLVLTDWLEEHGDEADCARAEYCRLCFDKLGKKVYASDWEKGERRRELFLQWKKVWLGGLVDLLEGGHCAIRRGVLQIAASGALLLQSLEQGVPDEIGGWIEELRVYGLNPLVLEQLARSPILEGPTQVHLHGDLSDPRGKQAILALAGSPYLNQVRQLGLYVTVRRPSALDPLKKRFGKAIRTS